ncbi:MAG: murein biosynthesis integral membrane protein MurJ [Deltaproteobacteria bacterium]|nr:murein biosynthesis integral membrane protein MurJ [Deltaproteobacteria bacterium]
MGETERTVTRRAGIVGLGTMASRILGLVRESVIAAYFPKEAIDAYQVAFMIPNSFRRLTAEGSFSISVTTVFSKIWSKDELAESQRFVRATLGFALMFLTALVGIGMYGADGMAWLAGRGFASDPEKFALAADLTRTMFPYVLLVSLTALAMGVLNSAGKFFAPAFAPVLLNVSIIGCAVGLAGTMPELGLHPIFALAIGVLIGGVAQVALQLPALSALKLLVRPAFALGNRGLRQVLKITLPMVFGAAAYQVGLFVSANLASTLGDGAVTYIQFAARLMELPLAVLVMAISTAALPSLAALKGQGKLDQLKRTYGHALRLALFVATPAAVGLIVLAEPVITILYQRGLFTHADAVETAAALRWMAAGTCSVALVRQTVPVFYALEKVRVPVLMTVVNIGVFAACAVLLMKPFGHEGLCMALSIAATAQGLGLVLALRSRLGGLGLLRIGLNWLRMLGATLPMAVAAWGVSQAGRWELGGNSARNIGVLVAAVVAGVVVYALVAFAFRSPELGELLAAFRSRGKGKDA